MATKTVAGIQIVEATHYETQTGGEIIIGRCTSDRNHLIVFAHIEIHEATELAAALNDAVLKYGETEGEA